MGMFDYINGHQVKCLECELNSYNTGEKINSQGVYPKNVLFLETPNYEGNPFSRVVHIIKDYIVVDTVVVADLIKIDLSDNEGIYLTNGKRINAKNYEDIYNYLYEEAKYELKSNFIEYSIEYNKKDKIDAWELTDKLYEEFKDKWYKVKE